MLGTHLYAEKAANRHNSFEFWAKDLINTAEDQLSIIEMNSYFGCSKQDENTEHHQ